MVQLLSLSKFVLQPQASQVHRCPPEPEPDDSPPPSDGDDDSPLLLADLSIFEKGCKHTSNRYAYLVDFSSTKKELLYYSIYRQIVDDQD